MYGFPKELYEVQYHPKGCQELTDDILALLPDISINDDWGIEGPQYAYDIGKALAPLREKDTCSLAAATSSITSED